jgi:hypothetical protein
MQKSAAIPVILTNKVVFLSKLIIIDRKMTSPLKKIILHVFIYSLILLVAGCSQTGKNGFKTTIKGTFPAFKGKSVSLSEYDINSAIPIDTVNISDNGHFSFKFKRSGPGFYLLKVDNKNYITLILDRETKLEISSELPNLRQDYHVKGSPDSELYRDFEMSLEVNRNKVDSLSRAYNDYQRSGTFRTIKLELDKGYQDIFENQRKHSVNFLENHCSSLASLLVINRRFGERKILTEQKDFKYFTLIDSCLSSKYPENKLLAENKKRIENYREQNRINELTEKVLAIGKKAPDIKLETPAGKTVDLYSLQGKPVILYFWASWDQQSRTANRALKDMLEKSARLKPAVYAIAFESYKELWQDAIKVDELQPWVNVTDYMNIYSSAKVLFNVPDEFPYFFLLDKDLNIRYKGKDFSDLAREINNQMP